MERRREGSHFVCPTPSATTLTDSPQEEKVLFQRLKKKKVNDTFYTIAEVRCGKKSFFGILRIPMHSALQAVLRNCGTLYAGKMMESNQKVRHMYYPQLWAAGDDVAGLNAICGQRACYCYYARPLRRGWSFQQTEAEARLVFLHISFKVHTTVFL